MKPRPPPGQPSPGGPRPRPLRPVKRRGSRAPQGGGQKMPKEREPALQAQPRQDEDRRHLRARRGRPEPLAPRRREGPLDRREADVRQGEEDPRLGAHVREEPVRGGCVPVARGRPHRRGREADGEACSHRREEAVVVEGDCGRVAARVPSGVWVVLVAAGRGERLGEERPKAFARLGELPMLAEPLRRLDESEEIDGIVIVAPPGWEQPAILLAGEAGASKVAACVPGGETRSASVRAGLAEVPDDAATILVHDAARPLLPRDLVPRLLAALADGVDGAVPGVAVTDTVKRVRDGAVAETPPRDELVAVQTPQAFRAAALRAAAAGDASDCAALVEAAGGRVKVVAGDERLLKVTTPDDLARAEALLAAERGG